MFVLTIDQRASRRGADLVPDLLTDLDATLGHDDVVLPFVRTVGDEVQGVLGSPDAVVTLVLDVVRRGGWSTGVGVGEVHPGETAPASTGSAFVHAREAVERAKGRTLANALAVHGDDAPAAARVEAVLQLLASVVRRRTPAQWRALDLLGRPDATGVRVARELGVTPQNVSQLRRDALGQEEAGVREVAVHLLSVAAGRIES
ncbi:hypothetical protein [Litorihabitans aurantiacus]|uniref:SatD family (SatD) n=1 Tax=Litorihabitans aurantiacus TaxID=1930061 RepID=A0AA37XDV6_9MICO|nr:hypothetical protein [Litorihabitans aurantiacus]GMA31352.1 hypothetical protein GCM10025875_13440 [Litorihabitans aurantiacus]